MVYSSPTNIWIQLPNAKLTINEFIESAKDDTSDQLKAVVDFIKDWQSEIPYISQKTSGSTGSPKTIHISKSQIKASSLATLKTLGIKSGDHALLCINPEYIGGKMMIARALIGGLNLSIAPITGNPMKDFNSQDQVDFFSFVPYQMERILEESPKKIQFLDNSKAIILGGAPVSDALAQKISSKLLKTKVYSTYGMTETVSHVALKLINSDQQEAFRALEKVSFSVDERNCLVIHAPEITGEDSLITNDVVDLKSTTEFQWLGRQDFVINSGGIKIHPEMLEKDIAGIFGKINIKNRFFAFGLEDTKLGEIVNLLIEGKVNIEEVNDLLRRNLKPYHAPKNIYLVEQFAETENGKINRIKTVELLKHPKSQKP